MPVMKAILGPTNTGKTHYALDRMMAHATGMIGLPLRLLAREVYDRVVEIKGPQAVALITGEERILPDRPRYWVCTVEAMPQNVQVECLAIDEIQLAEDADRGHVFTDCILHARGTQETLLLGAETMREILRDLDIDVSTSIRERFSELSYAGPKKITKLPKRSAIVAFSADQVYAIAEVLRRQKGGCAVVMGGLSPRTRNAQVALYQSGEVDYLVATDAIGMGLNLNVDRIAFAGRMKFDGRRRRWLSAAELGQIAGRAGRFRDNGLFGETADCTLMEDELVQAIENHQYESVAEIQWRNSDLDFRSIKTLIASLSVKSPHPALRLNPYGLDEWVLRRMAEADHIGPDVRGKARIRRLWDLARLPDFRKAGHEGHGRLVLGLAETLADPEARLGETGLHERLKALDNIVGDVGLLQQRLAMIRTWTYASFRDDWLENPEYWRERTRAIEDRLSDALHDALILRFVDRRTTALIAGLKREDLLTTEVTQSGEVHIEGHLVGHLSGLVFRPETNASTLEGKTLRNAAMKALAPIIADRLKAIAGAPETALALNETGQLVWQDAPVAQLQSGPHWLAPSLHLIGGEGAELHQQEAATARLNEWLGNEIEKRLPTHFRLKFSAEELALEGLVRGLAFRLLEAGAACDLREEDRTLQPGLEDRAKLKAAGIRSGRIASYIPDAQKPAAQRLIAILQGLTDGRVHRVAPAGAGSFELDGEWPEADLAAQGYLRFGKRAVRADLAERLGWELSNRRKQADQPAFEIPPELASLVSCPLEDFHLMLRGYNIAPAKKDPETGAVLLWRFQSRAVLEQKQMRRQQTRQSRTTEKSGQRSGQRARQKKDDPDGAVQSGRPSAAHSSPRKNRSDRPDNRKRQGPAGRRPQTRLPDPDSPFAALKVLLPDQGKQSTARKKKPKKSRARPPAPDQAVKPDMTEAVPPVSAGPQSGSEPHND